LLSGALRAAMSATSILMYGHEPRLLETRQWVLEKAGFAVRGTTHLSEAMKLVEEHGPTLLIVCHTLSAADCDQVLTEVRVRRPDMKMLILTTHLPVSHQGHGVEVLSAFIGPRVLLAAVEKALGM
jgi:DNA-binding response OmpR family regulator